MSVEDLIKAIEKADSEMHGADQAYLDLENPSFALIDGRINLVRVAEILNTES